MSSSRHSIAILAFLFALSILLSSGCANAPWANWNWRGKGFGNNEGGWAQSLRPPADERQFSGVDARAQEIERNLGVR